jgi:3-oxoacyl-[acyl-carrier protein] reductase
MVGEKRVALITGGSSGLGRAVAVELAQKHFYVAITARSHQRLSETAELIEQAGGRVLVVQADVTARNAVEAMVARVEHEFGAIDLLVNSAGVFQALGEFWKIDPDDWWRELEINVRGPLLCSRAVLPGMVGRKGGRIINMASGAGLLALETVSAYCASKTALIRFSESLALETQAHGIAVFAVDPGTVRTPMSDYAASSEIVGRDAPLVQQYFHYVYESGLDTPIDKSVKLVCDLASGRADALSGCFLDINDDLDELVQRAGEIRQNRKLRLGLIE